MSSGNVSIARSTRTGAVVANIAKTQNSKTGKFLKSVIAAAALSACAMAHADVTLTFEGQFDSPFIFNATQLNFPSYYVQGYNGTTEDGLVGSIVDGRDSDTCGPGLSCPVNNKSNYYAALDDGFVVFGLNDNSQFKLQSLQASFIGAGQASYPSVAGYLVLQGYDANFNIIASTQLALSGPTNGAFNFATYNTTALSNTLVSAVRVLGYSCDVGAANCVRSTNLSNFAIDNVVTVPEPMSLALLGLGLAGIGAARRRRA